ncbi:glycoside hydrolase family 61 protein [Hyaloscypha variabilis F]|uniref:lytic cellulose monooxygenase (C4-dehydrogenating) n=1 Tax=Hyaloscypha variabilis (strain UAMH 11265 / GT02V1 / F) TaxID=1149755 RepID=A0A2J6R7Q3_HYAVF|nr:glycoside hydrolase family 61 protein [Hyaloscypha variabilis F]
MKTAVVICALAAVASAHYTFPSLIANDETTAAWQYARQWTGYQSNGPVTDVSKIDIRCNVGASAKSAPSTMTVAAGSKIGFASNQPISHVGVMEWYMAKVPEGHTAATWDGSGEVWFKIDEDHPTFAPLKWPSLSTTKQYTTIPASVPAGDYLLRVEHIALHSAGSTNGAQFYISCGQLNVTGGGAGVPTPLVAFPGAYKASDPGILINIYNPVPKSYINPGPAVWKG